MVDCVCKCDSLHSEWKQVGLNKDLRWSLLLYRAVGSGDHTLVTLPVSHQQCFSVVLLLLPVKFDNLQFLLGEASCGIPSLIAWDKIVFCEQRWKRMLLAVTNVVDLVLVHDSAGNTIYQTYGDYGRVWFLESGNWKHVAVEILEN